MSSAIHAAVAMQEAAGLDVVSDGEWWRKSYIGVIAELAERTEAVAATERRLIAQLQDAAGGLQRVIDELRERQVHTSTTGPTGLVPAPMAAAGPAIDPALAHLPPPPVAMWPTAAGDDIADARP